MRDLGESLGGKLQREEARSRVFPPGEVETGVVLNAAVILKDPKKIPETITAIEAQGKKDGLPLKAIDWQKAAGLIGQFINVARDGPLHRDPDHLHRSRWSSSTTRW